MALSLYVQSIAAAGMLCLAACGADAPTDGLTTEEGTITVSPSSLELAAGDSIRLAVATNGRFQGGVSWRSTDSLIAVVAPTGMVRGVRSGTTTIVATSLADSVGVAAAVVIVR